ncbi:hypothetical protein KP803_07920 [Vibrio sp. ZSDE26]|uniref:Uncharacterized protein n=1 Tax=Vibrio amylolyticus TaxID=2847292 RepID=A0A9X1XIU3_9VIBR|nr:hypothetical protein [Vibrio amylolyticus]MCK6263201.1 hypothetical protein [Vibrio amylolyticus]
MKAQTLGGCHSHTKNKDYQSLARHLELSGGSTVATLLDSASTYVSGSPIKVMKEMHNHGYIDLNNNKVQLSTNGAKRFLIK